MAAAGISVSSHFTGKGEVVKAAYDRIIKAVGKFGDFTEDPKKTSIHLNRRTAFAGIATRKDSLLLTIKSSADIPSPRIRRHEKASANRWHLEVLLTSPDDIDEELTRWLAAAYELAA